MPPPRISTATFHLDSGILHWRQWLHAKVHVASLRLTTEHALDSSPQPCPKHLLMSVTKSKSHLHHPLPARNGHTLLHLDDRGDLVIVKAAPVSQEGSCIFLKEERICGVLKLLRVARASPGASQLLNSDSLLFSLFKP